MNRHGSLLTEVRWAIARYLSDSGEKDAPLVLRRLHRDLRKTDWLSLIEEHEEIEEQSKEIQEKRTRRHAENRDERIIYAQNQRAKKAGVAYNLTLEQWLNAIHYFNGLCAYCQERPYEVLEHYLSIPLGGTTVDNCVPACARCNNKKRKCHPDVFINRFPQENMERIHEYLTSYLIFENS